MGRVFLTQSYPPSGPAFHVLRNVTCVWFSLACFFAMPLASVMRCCLRAAAMFAPFDFRFPPPPSIKQSWLTTLSFLVLLGVPVLTLQKSLYPSDFSYDKSVQIENFSPAPFLSITHITVPGPLFFPFLDPLKSFYNPPCWNWQFIPSSPPSPPGICLCGLLMESCYLKTFPHPYLCLCTELKVSCGSPQNVGLFTVPPAIGRALERLFP